jgi:hypothetical protein
MRQTCGSVVSELSGRPVNDRGRGVLAVIVALTTIVGVAAFFIGRGVQTPAEQAAKAAPPSASLLTAPLRRRPVRAVIVLRATLHDDGAVAVDGPLASNGDLPVVSAIAMSKGSVIVDGDLIGAVAGRPVIVMQGVVPAYAAMRYGSTGVDVTELQRGLAALGYSLGSDEAGVYGAGTAAAVGRLYARAGYSAVDMPGPARTAKRAAKPVQYATVPLGEVAFVPSLPVDIVAVARPGSTLSNTKPLARLADGRLTFTVSTDINTGGLLVHGSLGRAVSDISGGSFAIRLVAKHQASQNGTPHTALSFAPVSQHAATSYVGQNMGLRVSTGQRGGLQWVVPVAAVVTSANGASSVTVIRDGHQLSVPVRAGLAYQGSEVVTPLSGRFYNGEQVSLGTGVGNQ